MERSQRLSSSDVEINVPKEIVEEARGSGSCSSVKPRSMREKKKSADDDMSRWGDDPDNET
eukprot:7054703-Karenia_brevis.AAC.1